MNETKKLSERVRDGEYHIRRFADGPPIPSISGIGKLADEIAALECHLEDINGVNKRDGSWMDKLGCCRVCDGEIPEGHTAECDYYKLEQRLEAALSIPVDDNGMPYCNYNNCAVSHMTKDEIASLKTRLEAAETEKQQAIDAVKALAEKRWPVSSKPPKDEFIGSDNNPVDVLIGDEPTKFLHGRNAPLYDHPPADAGTAGD